MNKLIWFLLGALVGFLSVSHVYNKLIGVKSIISALTEAHYLGCLTATHNEPLCRTITARYNERITYVIQKVVYL